MCIEYDKKNYETIYHYCSLDAFKQIVENKELWLTDAFHLNDKIELQWMAQKIKDTLLLLYKNQSEDFKQKYEKSFEQLVDNYYRDYFTEEQYYRMFVFCLSKNGDLLSQWRGYGDNGQGISIGFNVNTLLNMSAYEGVTEPLYTIGEIDYDKEAKKSKNYVAEFAKLYLFPQLIEIDNANEENFISNSMAPFNTMFREMFKNASLVKSPFFEEEQEVRLCFWDTLNCSGMCSSEKIRISAVQYRTKSNVLIPYVKMNFSEYNFMDKLVSEIIIGPKCQVSESILQNLLRANDFNNVIVKKSNGYMYR